jgi:hypothetical protein
MSRQDAADAWFDNTRDVLETAYLAADELVYVPAEHERRYIERLLADFLAPGGRLLIANYAEGDPRPERGLLPGSHATRSILDHLAELGFSPIAHADGVDPLRRSGTRVAVMTAEEP